MRVEQTNIYQYDELSDDAKKVAREWWTDLENRSGDNSWTEYVLTDFKTNAALLGWNVTNTYWSGFWSQGDGAMFEGDWDAKRVCVAALRANVPKGEGEDSKQNNELNRIADMFEALVESAKAFGADRVGAGSKHCGHYYHAGSADIGVWLEYDDDRDYPVPQYLEFCKELRDASRALMNWLYRALELEYEYRLSDEQVADAIIANEYEFTADGKHWG